MTGFHHFRKATEFMCNLADDTRATLINFMQSRFHEVHLSSNPNVIFSRVISSDDSLGVTTDMVSFWKYMGYLGLEVYLFSDLMSLVVRKYVADISAGPQLPASVETDEYNEPICSCSAVSFFGLNYFSAKKTIESVYAGQARNADSFFRLGGYQLMISFAPLAFLFLLEIPNVFSSLRPPRDWMEKIQEEWKKLEKDLPSIIFVRTYESRMDLLRVVIIGSAGTPYHDGLFVFDIHFPPTYPSVPSLYHCNYNEISNGMRYVPIKLSVPFLNDCTSYQFHSKHSLLQKSVFFTVLMPSGNLPWVSWKVTKESFSIDDGTWENGNHATESLSDDEKTLIKGVQKELSADGFTKEPRCCIRLSRSLKQARISKWIYDMTYLGGLNMISYYPKPNPIGNWGFRVNWIDLLWGC
ncbi:ubiquitin-conjugating enzyme/RWD-like protein [Artemisia annua]|uniref:Ubiquitin-conjugating enzyme/RWD-like protein n=1 Tax=Artemisia annua TaxID=35608 RepID=A0A2U1LQR6_ARTAN|nr:ubiquitin-conjugating enzyme/RWD-like protein [Artemisia annua]